MSCCHFPNGVCTQQTRLFIDEVPTSHRGPVESSNDLFDPLRVILSLNSKEKFIRGRVGLIVVLQPHTQVAVWVIVGVHAGQDDLSRAVPLISHILAPAQPPSDGILRELIVGEQLLLSPLAGIIISPNKGELAGRNSSST